jgi:hypothetical protein
MLENEYRLEIQFKKVQKIRNINNIPTVGSRPLECKPAQNGLYMVFKCFEIKNRRQGPKTAGYRRQLFRTLLTDKFVMQKTKGRLYACFVDFKKAFDSVWHEGLFKKLFRNNTSGNFYKLIKSLYSQTPNVLLNSLTTVHLFSHTTKGYAKDAS